MDKKAKVNLPSLSTVRKALYADWALCVKQRDGWKCLLCGCEENLTAHHWYCSDHHAHAARYCVDNGATLCYACHIRGVHTRADYVTVARVQEAVGPADTMAMNALINTDLTTATLRNLWDAMRRRSILLDEMAFVSRKKDKWVLTVVDTKRQIAVVGNTIHDSEGRLFEVNVVTVMENGYYRYTMRQIEE